MSFLRELWAYLRTRRKFWLVPILIAMTLLAHEVALPPDKALPLRE